MRGVVNAGDPPSAAALAGPSVGTLVLDHGGAGVLWGGCCALGLLAAAGMLLLGPRLPEGT